MAQSQKDLEGWTVIVTDKDGKPVDRSKRRSRRAVAEEIVHVERVSDGLRFGRGDSLVMQDHEANTFSVHMVNELRLNSLNNVLEIVAFTYLRRFEMDPIAYYRHFDPAAVLSHTDDISKLKAKLEQEVEEKELFLTAECHEIWLKDLIGVAHVVSEREWKDDEPRGEDTFLLRYVCEPVPQHFISLDADKLSKFISELNPKKFEECLRQISLPPAISKRTTARSTSDIEDYEDNNSAGSDQSFNSEQEEDSISEESFESEHEEAQPVTKKRKPKTVPKTKVKRKLISTPTPPAAAKSDTPIIRKFTKRNVARAKKKYTPFSKRYKSIKDIPDLKKLAEFNQTLNEDRMAALQDKLRAPRERKVVETIFSKFKKQLNSTHGKDEIVKMTDFSNYLPARENEYATIYLSLSSAIEAESSTSIYVAGTPGVGKTLTVREVIKELRTSAQQNEIANFQYLEINGLKMVKPTDSYEVLWNRISGESLTWGAAMESLEFYFNKVPKDKKWPVVVLLDELDALVTKAQDIMYNFFNWTTYSNANLIVIAVANTMDLPERQLGNKVSSRIGFTRIMFTGYTHEELKSIIEFRLKGLNNSYFYVDTETGSAYQVDSSEEQKELPAHVKKIRLKMSDDAIEIVARKVASVSGDARRALKVCRRAAEIAEEHYMAKHGYRYEGLSLQDQELERQELGSETEKENEQVVHIFHVTKALNETVNSNTVLYVSKLPFTARLFLYALLNLVKKSGLQEQPLGDIVDEIKLLLDVNGKSKYLAGLTTLLFQQSLPTAVPQLRMVSWELTINELVETGILVKQNMKNERLSCVKLAISAEDVWNAINQDATFKNL